MTQWKWPWCWERLKVGGEGDDRRWDDWMASLIQCTWVWASSGSWWWTGKPGVLQSMGLQRVGHNWVTELNWYWGHGHFHCENLKKEEQTVIDERGLAEGTKESPLPSSLIPLTITLTESPHQFHHAPVERWQGQLPFWPTHMTWNYKKGKETQQTAFAMLSVSNFRRVIFWFMETWIYSFTNISGKPIFILPPICSLVPVPNRAVKLCTDHFIKIDPFICCQRATKELLCVCGDSRIMLEWIIERQILAKILSVTPRIAIAIPKPSSWEKP